MMLEEAVFPADRFRVTMFTQVDPYEIARNVKWVPVPRLQVTGGFLHDPLRNSPVGNGSYTYR